MSMLQLSLFNLVHTIAPAKRSLLVKLQHVTYNSDKNKSPLLVLSYECSSEQLCNVPEHRSSKNIFELENISKIKCVEAGGRTR